jgi:hypothetical protein
MLNRSKFLRLQERHKESGLNIKSFCSNEDIALSSFYYWQKKIKNETNGKRFIPLLVKSTGTIVHPVTHPPQSSESISFEITYPNGITLRIKNDLDLEQLRTLISLLD